MVQLNQPFFNLLNFNGSDGDNPPPGPGEPKNPMITDLSSIGVRVALFTFSLLGLLCFAIFCSVRTYFKDIYSPRRALKSGRPPRLPKGWLSWIGTVWSIPESFVLTTVGLDGVMLLRFMKMSGILFTILSVLGLTILVPINYAAFRPTYTPENPYDEIAALRELTIENVPTSSPWLRVHLSFTWIFSIIAYGCLLVNYRAFVDLKQHYTEHVLRRTRLTKIEYRSLIVFGVPRELRHEIDLAAFFESLGVGAVENVVICRKWTHLRDAVKRRAESLYHLESIYNDVKRGVKITPTNSRVFGISRSGSRDLLQPSSSSAFDPLMPSSSQSSEDASISTIMSFLQAIDPRKRPTHRVKVIEAEEAGWIPSREDSHSKRSVYKAAWARWFGPSIVVDSANYWAEQYRKWDARVSQLRKVPETSPSTAVAFVTFESPQSAAIACQIILHRRPFTCMAKMAPEPRDIYWPNLSSRAADNVFKLFRNLSVNFVSIMIVFFSTFFIVFVVAPLVTIKNLNQVPFLKELFERLGEPIQKFIEQVVPISLFAGWTSSLPVVLIGKDSYHRVQFIPSPPVLCQMQGLEAESWLDVSVFGKYFFFLTFNVLLFVAGQTIWYSLNLSKISGKSVLDILGNSMPKSSSSMIGYVMLQSLAILPAQLLLIAPIVLTYVARMAPWSESWTPRQLSDAYHPTQLTSLHYGITYAMAAMIFVVGFTYSTIAPLILPFCAIYFFLAFFIYKYQLLYVHAPKFETAGMHTPHVTKRAMLGIALMQITMMAVLAIKYGGPAADPTDMTLLKALTLLDSPGWSGYAQMVIGVLPLLFITLFLSWWMGQGYDKLANHMPMEIVGKLMREFREHGTFSNQPRGPPLFDDSIPQESGVHSDSESVPEAHQVWRQGTPPAIRRKSSLRLPSQENESGRHHLSHQPTVNGTELRATPHVSFRNGDREAPNHAIELQDESLAPLLGSSVKRLSRQDSIFTLTGATTDAASLLDETRAVVQEPESDDEEYHRNFVQQPLAPPGNTVVNPRLFSDDDYDDEASEVNTRSPLLPTSVTSPNLPSPSNRRGSSGQHFKPLEPPSTRVPGILDAIEEASALLVGTDPLHENTSGVHGHDHMTAADLPDLQSHTYIHPVLIGRLPVAWLPGQSQPERLNEARNEQAKNQRTQIRRLIALQRAGVAVMEGRLAEAEAAAAAGNDRINLGWFGVLANNPNNDQRFGFLDALLNFFDGLTSWAHLQMS